MRFSHLQLVRHESSSFAFGKAKELTQNSQNWLVFKCLTPAGLWVLRGGSEHDGIVVDLTRDVPNHKMRHIVLWTESIFWPGRLRDHSRKRYRGQYTRTTYTKLPFGPTTLTGVLSFVIRQQQFPPSRSRPSCQCHKISKPNSGYL